jgi:voltage-gated sodium channel
MFARVAATGARKQADPKQPGEIRVSHTQKRVLEDMEHFFDKCFSARKQFRASVDRLIALNVPPAKTIPKPQENKKADDAPKEVLEELEELDAKYSQRRRAVENKLSARTLTIQQQIAEQRQIVEKLQRIYLSAQTENDQRLADSDAEHKQRIQSVQLGMFKSETWQDRLLQSYIDMGVRYVTPLLQSTAWDVTVFAAIIGGAVFQGAETYMKEGDYTSKVLNALEMVVLAIFCLEFLLRIVAEGVRPWRYWTDRWNNFDFAVLITLFVALAYPEAGLGFLRLARLAKLGKFSPKLTVILRGLCSGISSVGSMMCLLFILYYFYAIVGIILFRGTDPFHFSGLGPAFLTMVQLTLLSGWNDIFMLNYFGCGRYSGAYAPKCEEGSSNNFCASLDDLTMASCEGMVTHPALTILYFVSFILLVSMVMLALVVSSITVEMAGAIDSMQEADDITRTAASARMVETNWKSDVQSIVCAHANVAQWKRWAAVKKFLGSCWCSSDGDIDETIEAIFGIKIEQWSPIPASNHALTSVERLSKACRRVVNDMRFEIGMMVVIAFACILVGIETDGTLASLLQVDTGQSALFEAIEWVIRLTFTGEALIRILAVVKTPGDYFFDGWNIMDFLIVILSWVSLVHKGLQNTQVLRLGRVLRVLKLAKNMPHMRMSLESITNSGSSLGWTGVILLVYFYSGSLVGMMLFKENDEFHFGHLMLAFNTIFRVATLDDWESVLYINVYGCSNPVPNLANYGSTDVFCKDGGSPRPVIAYFFFLFCVFIGGLILMNLFIGIITGSMDNAAQKQIESRDLEKRVRETTSKFHLGEEQAETTKEEFDLLSFNDDSIDKDELRFFLELTFFYIRMRVEKRRRSTMKHLTGRKATQQLAELEELDIDPAIHRLKHAEERAILTFCDFVANFLVSLVDTDFSAAIDYGEFLELKATAEQLDMSAAFTKVRTLFIPHSDAPSPPSPSSLLFLWSLPIPAVAHSPSDRVGMRIYEAVDGGGEGRSGHRSCNHELDYTSTGHRKAREHDDINESSPSQEGAEGPSPS